MGKHILGIDVGGSGIKGAIVDITTGELVSERFRLKTIQPATPLSLAGQIKEIVKHHHWKGLSGVGFPAVVDKGFIYSASNIHKDWINTNIHELLNGPNSNKIQIVNDAGAAGLAEVNFGAGKGRNGKVLLLTLGTGIGSALFLNGDLISNTELGHVYLQGHKKVAEKYASNAVREREELSWPDWAKRVDEYLVHINSLFYPDLIILGGGVSKHFEKYSNYFTLIDKIVPAQLKNNAGIVGAALYAESVYQDVSKTKGAKT